MDDVFPMVTTSMDKTEILQMLPTLIGYSVNDTTGFPSSFKFSNVKGSVIVPTSLESNVIELHKFLVWTIRSIYTFCNSTCKQPENP